MTQWSGLRLHDGGPCPVDHGDKVVPFGKASRDGRVIEMLAAFAGEVCWSHIAAYQVALPEPRDMIVPWHVLPKEYRWAAVDDDGRAYAYEETPSCFGNWWKSPSESHIRIDQLVGYDPGTKPWDQSLIQRPEGV